MAASASTSRTAEYRRFQQELADEISPEEASTAEDAFRRGRVALWAVAGGWAALVLVAAWLPERAGDVLSDLAFGALIVACLVLAGRYRVPFAGRLLLPLSVLETSLEPPAVAWTELGGLLADLLVLPAIAWVLGWLLDFGASPEVRKKRPRGAVACLWSFAAFLGSAWFWTASGLQEGETYPVASLLACAVCVAWPWWPGPWLERGRTQLVPDAEMLFHQSQRRWQGRLLGRALAIAFAVFPLFLLLNALDLREEGRLTAAPGQVVQTKGADGKTFVWLWPAALQEPAGLAEGRFLRPGDLGARPLYVVPEDRVEKEDLAGLIERIDDRPTDAEAFRTLQRRLAPFRLDAVEDLRRALPGAPEDMAILQLGVERSRPSSENRQGLDLHFVRDDALEPFAAGRVKQLRRPWTFLFLQAFLAICCVLGFLLLWRRGGDSRTARWLALCLVGTAMLAMAPYARFYFPALRHNLWALALQSPAYGIACVLLEALRGLAVGAVLLLSVSFAASWVQICWLPVSGRRRAVILRVLGVSAAFLAVGGLLTLAGRAVLPDLAGAASLAFALCAGAAVGGGAWLRRKTAARTELPELGRLAAPTFLAFLASFWIALLFFMAREALPAWVAVAGTVSLAAFALLAAGLILREDFLHLAAGRDLGQILLIAVLPVVFEVSEGLSGYLMADTLFASEAGKTVLGLLIVLALFAPLQPILERRAAYLAVRGLRRIEEAVEGALEWLVSLEDVAALRQAAAGFFAEMEIAEALLYRRAADGRMERLVGSAEAPETLVPSERLRAHLAGAGGSAVDLTRVHLDLRHFFLQHELARLEKATGGRYLLPICLGRSLRGLLILPDGPASRRVCRDVTGAEVGKLGLVVAEAGRAEAVSAARGSDGDSATAALHAPRAAAALPDSAS